jgi:hypothetical protein
MSPGSSLVTVMLGRGAMKVSCAMFRYASTGSNPNQVSGHASMRLVTAEVMPRLTRLAVAVS